MPRSPRWKQILVGSRREALIAVDLYNRAATERSLEGFVLHMHLAWLYLCHAKFERDGVEYFYRQPNGHFKRVDGEKKAWELQKCIEVALPKPDPIRANLELFIRVRNKVEHRFERDLATVLAGKVQAHLLNYEATLVEWFSTKESLGDDLRFPVFLSTLQDGAVTALKATYARLPRGVVQFLREFDAGLPQDVTEDWRYDFRVFLVAQSGPRSESDVTMRFIREDEMTDEQRQARDVVQTVIRTKQIPVRNLGAYRAKVVACRVQRHLGVRFSAASHHSDAWKHYEVRPPQGAPDPSATKEQFCHWDSAHGDYVYTDAWVERLKKQLADPKVFKKVIGRPPEPIEDPGCTCGTCADAG